MEDFFKELIVIYKKYLQLKHLGLRYIQDNQNLIYSEINK